MGYPYPFRTRKCSEISQRVPPLFKYKSVLDYEGTLFILLMK